MAPQSSGSLMTPSARFDAAVEALGLGAVGRFTLARALRRAGDYRTPERVTRQQLSEAMPHIAAVLAEYHPPDRVQTILSDLAKIP